MSETAKTFHGCFSVFVLVFYFYTMMAEKTLFYFCFIFISIVPAPYDSEMWPINTRRLSSRSCESYSKLRCRRHVKLETTMMEAVGVSL